MTKIQKNVAKLEKLCAKNNFLFSLYALPYRGVLNREIKLAKITETDTVLNVGCGAMPFTAIYIAQKTGARVIAMDKDIEAINKAKLLVEFLGLSSLIKVIHGDGVDIKELDYNKIVVALQVWPKEEVIANLLENSKFGVEMLVRYPRRFFIKYYGSVSLKADACARHLMLTFGKTYLFQKKVA